MQLQDYPNVINDDVCCTKTNLEATFRNEVGESDLQAVASQCCEENDLGKPHYSMENPFTVLKIIDMLKTKGHQSGTLQQIVAYVVKKYKSL